ATLLTRQDFNEFFFTHFLHSLFSGKDRDLKIQRQRVLYRGLTKDVGNDLVMEVLLQVAQLCIVSNNSYTNITIIFIISKL
ncbi:hypothetical protein ACMSEQ_17075, partial [Bacteroides thetaiotaomicron]